MVLLSNVLMGLILPSDLVIRKNADRTHVWIAKVHIFQRSDSAAGGGRPQVLSIYLNFGAVICENHL
jgi:hypothetical protein